MLMPKKTPGFCVRVSELSSSIADSTMKESLRWECNKIRCHQSVNESGPCMEQAGACRGPGGNTQDPNRLESTTQHFDGA